MDQGILWSTKCKYKDQFLRHMFDACNRGLGITGCLKEFTLKDAIRASAHAWSEVTKQTLTNAWYKLWLIIMFDVDDNDPDEFEGFRISHETQMVSNLLHFAKGMSFDVAQYLDENDIQEVFDIDSNAPVVNTHTNDEIVEMVLNPDKDKDSEDEYVDDQINILFRKL